ncbi:Ankyrin repeat-containing protein [Spironucleus salmonicida]|uniref:Ankyrin repeat-containing protein n=1 Tax=Spironucleus salmonicida TaxID=348837 RepID=V6LG54_9EUKA|nr:Ankyrin repeat-containing protein [Spironucleus salmonicida]|eukprot:EST43502.1 Ankyrin repeat-containing protein [Spironucleus salmonicida]
MSESTWFNAARTGDCRFLLQHKSSLAKSTEIAFPNNTALMIAAQTNQAAAAKLLIQLERGMTNKQGFSALHFAAMADNAQLAKFLAPFEGALRTKAHYKNIPPNASVSQVAALCGSSDVLKVMASADFVFLQHPWDHNVPCSQDELGCTRLHYFAVKGDFSTFSDPECAFLTKLDNQNQTALMIAAMAGNVGAVRALAASEGGIQGGKLQNSALMLAVEEQKIEAAALLKDREATLQNAMGLTALMLAAKGGSTEIVNLLRDSEAKMQTTKQFSNFAPGTTALMFAFYYNNQTCIEALLEAEKDIKNDNGQRFDQIGRLGNAVVMHRMTQRQSYQEGEFSFKTTAQGAQNSFNPETFQQEIEHEIPANMLVLEQDSGNLTQLFQLQETLNDAKTQMAVLKAQSSHNDAEIVELQEFLKMRQCAFCEDKNEVLKGQMDQIREMKKEHTALQREVEFVRNGNLNLSNLNRNQGILDIKISQIQDILLARNSASGQGAAQRQPTGQFGAISEPFTEVAEERLEAEGA